MVRGMSYDRADRLHWCATTSSYLRQFTVSSLRRESYSILPLSYDTSESKKRCGAHFRRFFMTEGNQTHRRCANLRQRSSDLTGHRSVSPEHARLGAGGFHTIRVESWRSRVSWETSISARLVPQLA